MAWGGCRPRAPAGQRDTEGADAHAGHGTRGKWQGSVASEVWLQFEANEASSNLSRQAFFHSLTLNQTQGK